MNDQATKLIAMKPLSTLLILLLFAACKQTPRNDLKNEQQDGPTVVEDKYPRSLSKVFEAHGGLELWKEQRTLSYSMERPNHTEVHTVDLHTRKDRIDADKFAMGFDGGQVWLQDADNDYKGNPGFYHNLMFYFYAMPFVLADDGIVYGHTEDLVFEGKHYPGIQIAYEDGIGASSKDEYYIHYDPNTNQMAWLGYTVTYFTKEKSKEWHFIKYSNWLNIDGLVLPETLSWYNIENNIPTTMRNDLKFTDIKISEEKPEAGIFEEPNGAELIP